MCSWAHRLLSSVLAVALRGLWAINPTSHSGVTSAGEVFGHVANQTGHMPTWLTFYDLHPDEQHGTLNLAFDGGREGGAANPTQCVKSAVFDNSSVLMKAWDEYRMPGLLDLECLGGDIGHGLYLRNASFECPSCPACAVCPIGSAVYLNPQWKELITTALGSAMPFLENGAIRGVSLGDEPCCGGLPVSDLAAVADFVKRAILHTRAFVYVNECGRTFMGIYMNGTDGQYPGMMTAVPHSIDIVSADTYTLPQFEANMDRRLYNGWAEFRGGGIYPALSPHQRVFVVPGLFADATKSRSESEALLLDCLEGFWAWAQNDTRVVGINAWHWNTWGSVPSPGPDSYMKLGAREFPRLTQRLKEIGGIMSTHGKGGQSDVPLSN